MKDNGGIIMAGEGGNDNHLCVVWLVVPQLLPLVLLLLVLPGQAGQEVSSKAGLHWGPACLLPRHGCHGDNEVVIIFCKKINVFFIIYFVFINISSHVFTIISTIPRSKWGVLVFSWSAGIMWANLFFVFLTESWNFYCRDDISYLAFLCTFSSPTSSSAWNPGTRPCSRCPTCWSPTTTRPTPSSAKTPGSSGRSELSFATYRSSDWDHGPRSFQTFFR